MVVKTGGLVVVGVGKVARKLYVPCCPWAGRELLSGCACAAACSAVRRGCSLENTR